MSAFCAFSHRERRTAGVGQNRTRVYVRSYVVGQDRIIQQALGAVPTCACRSAPPVQPTAVCLSVGYPEVARPPSGVLIDDLLN